MKKLFSLALAMFLLPSILFLSGCKNKPNDPPPTDAFVYEFSEDGKYVYFGEYPQTIKAEDVTITSTTPDDNGYYLGSDGERYYKYTVNVKSMAWCNSESEWQDYGQATMSNGYIYSQGEELYFKVERLKWRILSQENGQYFLMCENVLQECVYQPYYAWYKDSQYVKNADNEWVYEEDGVTMIYANNYKYSELRRFLTQDFYSMAFNYKQKAIINLTEVDNSVESLYQGSSGMVCENTFDYVFAPSYAEIVNSSYGFENDINRCLKPTDLAKATGVITYTREYWEGWIGIDITDPSVEPFVDCAGLYSLRSPVLEEEWGTTAMDAYCCVDGGCVGEWNYSFVNFSNIGVVPALYINIA